MQLVILSPNYYEIKCIPPLTKINLLLLLHKYYLLWIWKLSTVSFYSSVTPCISKIIY